MTLKYKVADSRDVYIAKDATTTLSSNGTFNFSFSLPGNANLGEATLELSLENEKFLHSFEIQEVRDHSFLVILP